MHAGVAGQAQELFLDLWREYRVTMVFATHSVEEAAVMGGRILMLTRRPGTVVIEIPNPSFGVSRARDTPEFHELVSRVRGIALHSWVTPSLGRYE
jgi:NitT/TauT family transport system ATP-binding protein